jgi:hypothetical protein
LLTSLERGSALLVGRGFEYKYLGQWVKCDVMLTTDYVQISWTRKYVGGGRRREGK